MPGVLFAALAGAQTVPSISPDQTQIWAAAVNNTSATVKITEFFDYQCPFCAANVPALEEALKSYSGKVQLVLRSTPLSIHPDSMLAHQAALAAGEQGKFWEMHHLLYVNRRKVKLPDLLEYAGQLKLDVNRFQERLQSGYYKTTVDGDLALAVSMHVDATPTFFINNQKLVGTQSAERLKQAIALALRDPDATFDPQAQTALAVKNLDLTHSPLRGSKDAPVTIIEFSDMQCPFCAAVVPALRQLLGQSPDQVRWVFKNFPLDFHADSPLAHRAVLAAGEQGKFWEMHDLVFADQHAMKRYDLLQKARTLGLDMPRFQADLDSPRLAQLVEADKQEGIQLNVSGTPTFFSNGQEYSGAMTVAQFQAIIGREMVAGNGNQPAPEAGKKQIEIASGPQDAPITAVWFSDLQSDLTLKATLQVRQLMNSHPGKVRLVFKNRPLESHSGAMKLHEAALAANAQGKFWQMHDLIIANPHKDDDQTLFSYASRLGLDVKRFQSELEGHTYRAEINQDLDEANRRSVLGTPVFFINSVRIDGLQPQATLERMVLERLANNVQAISGH